MCCASFFLLFLFLSSVCFVFQQKSLIFFEKGRRGSNGGQLGGHMWKFNVRGAHWNEDVAFGMKIAISWLL